MEIASTAPSPSKNVGNGYDTDFYAWTQEQARLLLQKESHGLDWANLAEEIASLGKQQKQELRNRLGILIGHLLKWDYQSDRRSKSWEFTIAEQREEILEILTDNPSLRPYLEEAVTKGYLKGMRLVLEETNVPKADLPQACPYTIAQLLDPSFPPDFSAV
jgi:hypothetical protein